MKHTTQKIKEVAENLLENVFNTNIEDMILSVKTFCIKFILALICIIAVCLIVYMLFTKVNNKWGDAGSIICFWFCWLIFMIIEVASNC